MRVAILAQLMLRKSCWWEVTGEIFALLRDTSHSKFHVSLLTAHQLLLLDLVIGRDYLGALNGVNIGSVTITGYWTGMGRNSERTSLYAYIILRNTKNSKIWPLISAASRIALKVFLEHSYKNLVSVYSELYISAGSWKCSS